jgi:bifunctional ADP-heptose synthase (sugar kinase/adenylyltransferase)
VAALALACKLEDEFLMRIANLAGGLVCEKVGVVPIQKQDLLKTALK